MKVFLKMKLLDRISRIRAMAATIYDRSLENGHSPAEVQSSIEPLRESLKKVVHHSVRHDLKGCVLAIKGMQNQSLGLAEDIKNLKSKIEENNFYIKMFEDELRPLIPEEGFLESEGFSVSLGSNGGLTFR